MNDRASTEEEECKVAVHTASREGWAIVLYILILAAFIGLGFWGAVIYPLSIIEPDFGPLRNSSHAGLFFWNWHYPLQVASLIAIISGIIWASRESSRGASGVFPSPMPIRYRSGTILATLGVAILLLNSTVLPYDGHLKVLLLYDFAVKDLEYDQSILFLYKKSVGRYPADLREIRHVGSRGEVQWNEDIYDRFSKREEKPYVYVSDGARWIIVSVGPDGRPQTPPKLEDLKNLDAYMERAAKWALDAENRKFLPGDIIWTSEGARIPPDGRHLRPGSERLLYW